MILLFWFWSIIILSVWFFLFNLISLTKKKIDIYNVGPTLLYSTPRKEPYVLSMLLPLPLFLIFFSFQDMDLDGWIVISLTIFFKLRLDPLCSSRILPNMSQIHLVLWQLFKSKVYNIWFILFFWRGKFQLEKFFSTIYNMGKRSITTNLLIRFVHWQSDLWNGLRPYVEVRGSKWVHSWTSPSGNFGNGMGLLCCPPVITIRIWDKTQNSNHPGSKQMLAKFGPINWASCGLIGPLITFKTW